MRNVLATPRLCHEEINDLASERYGHVKTTKPLLRTSAASAMFIAIPVLCLALAQGSHCYAQAQDQPQTQTKLAKLHEPGNASSDGSADVGSTASAPAAPAAAPEPAVPAAVAKELAAMKARIEQLELQLKANAAPAQPPAPVAGALANANQPAPAAAPAIAAPPQSESTSTAPSGIPAKKEKIAPFSDWDWTWLNGNPRNKDTAFDSKFFTPEIRADFTYNYDFDKPKDDSEGGSSELFRSNEMQLEQLGVGGDFHYDNVRARFMTQFGMYSVATPRNDPSPAKGQW
jgi:hypothetical protein